MRSNSLVNASVRSKDARTHLAHDLHHGRKVERAITILAPPAEIFDYWRDFTNLPKFMSHLTEIRPLSHARALWIWRTVGGLTLEWTTEIIAEIPNQMISWQSAPESQVNHAGSVWLKPSPQDHATEVVVQVLFRVPFFHLAQTLSEFFGEEPRRILGADLRRLKWLLETGEVPTTRGQPHGSGSRLH